MVCKLSKCNVYTVKLNIKQKLAKAKCWYSVLDIYFFILEIVLYFCIESTC